MANVVFEETPKVSISEFLDDLAYEFTDAPYGLLENAVKRTVQRICEHSNILRRDIFITTQCNVHNYLLEPTDCMEIIAVMSVCAMTGGCCMREVTRLTSVPCNICCAGNEMYVDRNEVVFTRPGNGTVFKLNVSVKPSKDACEIDKSLVDDHYELIIAGVRSMLCALPDKPWSSIQRAQLFELEFMHGCADAAIDQMSGKQRGAMRIKRQRVL